MRFDADHIRQQIANLLMQYPELAEDDVLRADMVEGETDAHEFLRTVEDMRQEAAAFAGAIEGSIADLETRQARYERREKAMRALMFKVLEAAGQRKVELPEATISVGAPRDKVVISDKDSVPVEFRRPGEPNLTEIRAALKKGERFNWAAIVQGEPTLTIRVK